VFFISLKLFWSFKFIEITHFFIEQFLKCWIILFRTIFLNTMINKGIFIFIFIIKFQIKRKVY